jgi:hypothetical protein
MIPNRFRSSCRRVYVLKFGRNQIEDVSVSKIDGVKSEVSPCTEQVVSIRNT